MSSIAPLVGLLFYAVILFLFDWVIRVAVRHAIQDADRRRGAGPPAP